MKAVVCEKYGPPDVLQIRDVAKPSPKDNEVLIRVRRAGVCGTDPFRTELPPHPEPLPPPARPLPPLLPLVAEEIDAHPSSPSQ